MSRPKPKVLLEHTDKKSYRTQQILETSAIWAVFYKDRPVNLKVFSLLGSGLNPKYKKISFSNPGHARNLAKKLNHTFDCNDFSVYELSTGKKLRGNQQSDFD
jgi:hypothetical protein